MLMIKKYSQLAKTESIEKSSIELSCSDENSTELIMRRYENNLHFYLNIRKSGGNGR